MSRIAAGVPLRRPRRRLPKRRVQRPEGGVYTVQDAPGQHTVLGLYTVQDA